MVQEITDPELLSRLNGAVAPVAKKRKPDELTERQVLELTKDNPLQDPKPEFQGITMGARGERLANPAAALSGVAGYPEVAPAVVASDEVTDPALLQQLNTQPAESPPFMARVGRGVMDLVQGARQIDYSLPGAEVVRDPAEGVQYNKDVNAEIAGYNRGVATEPGWLGVDWARGLGQAGASSIIPFGAGAKLAGMAGRGIKTALTDAGITGAATSALNFVEEGGSRLKNALWGGAGGPVGVGIGKGVGAGAGKVVSAVAGRNATPENLATKAAAKEFGVDLRTGDLSPLLRSPENMLESVPFSGVHGKIKKQAEQLGDMLNIGEQKFLPEKMRLKTDQPFNAFSDTGGAGVGKVYDDPNALMVDSLKTQFAANKADVDGLYDKMRDLSGGAKFDPSEAKATAIELLNKELTLPASQRNAAMVKELQGVLKWTPMDFATGHATRSRMGESLAQLERKTASGTASRVEMAAMTKLQKAVEKDMEVAAKANPGLLAAWKTADKGYRERLAPYHDKSIQRIMNGEFDSDLLADKYLKANRPNLANDLMGLMDKDGQQAAKFAVFKRAKDAATDPKLEAGISNVAFDNKIGLGTAEKAIFTPDEQKYLKQMTDVMRATRRAATWAADPKTGNRLAKLTGLGTLLGARVGTGVALNPLYGGLILAGGGLTGRGLNALSWSDLGHGLAGTASPGKPLVGQGPRRIINRGTGGLGAATLMQLNSQNQR